MFPLVKPVSNYREELQDQINNALAKRDADSIFIIIWRFILSLVWKSTNKTPEIFINLQEIRVINPTPESVLKIVLANLQITDGTQQEDTCISCFKIASQSCIK